MANIDINQYGSRITEKPALGVNGRPMFRLVVTDFDGYVNVTVYLKAQLTARSSATSVNLGGTNWALIYLDQETIYSVIQDANYPIGSKSVPYGSWTNVATWQKTTTIQKTHSSQSHTVSAECSIRDSTGNYDLIAEQGSGTGSYTFSVSARPSGTLSFNANSGSGAPSSITTWYGETFTVPSTKPTRNGYVFREWNTSADGTGSEYSPGTSYTSYHNADWTVYAIWNPVVYFNANGGSGGPTSQTKDFNTNLTLTSSIPTRSTYVFKEWNTAADGSGTSYSPGSTYSTNSTITLYAIWYAPYSVTYDANGGINPPASQVKVYNQTLTLTSIKPTRDGWEFVEWNTQADGQGTPYNPGDSYTSNAAVTLYAQWRRIINSVVINDVNAIRVASSSSTTEADEGEYAYITVPFTVKGAASAEITLTLTVTAASGLTPAITYVTRTVQKPQASTADDLIFSGSLIARAAPCDVDIRYRFDAVITAVNQAASISETSLLVSTVLPTAFFTMDVRAGGHGVAFGKSSVRDGLDIGMPSYFSEAFKVAERLSLPVYEYATKPNESDLPSKPSLIVTEDGEIWLAIPDPS